MDQLQLTPIMLPVLAAMVVLAGFAAYAWRNRRVNGALVFALIAASVTLWLFSYSMKLASASLDAKVFWLRFKFIGVAYLPALWTIFAIQYTGRDRWLTRLNLVLMSIIPVGMLVLAFTNDSHHLVWTQHWLQGGLDYSSHGPYFWVFVGFNYLLLLGGTILFGLMFLRSPRLYRRQVGWVLVGAAVPWLANVLTIFNLAPVPGLDLTPLAFAVTAVVIGWSLFRNRLLDIVPVAYEAIVANMNDGVIVLDQQDRIVAFNPGAQTITGLSASGVVGQPAGRVLADWLDLLDRYHDVRSAQAEIAVGPENDRRNFDLRISPLVDRRGRYTGRLIILHDITERVRAAVERERLITELDAFAHTVAHDLKNPLGVTLGYSSLLMDRREMMDEDRVDRNLRIIERNSRKMQSIIDELLLLASVRQLDEIQTGPLDMGVVVAEAQERLLRMIEEAEAEIKMPEEWPVAVGYAPWVEEVWANYISNAIKYGGEPPRVLLGALVEDDMVRFWVRDNGPGIPAEARKSLFGQFTRLDETRAEGHGLGLSIVQRIVTRLGGKVGVKSDLGTGSVFSFTLPKAPGYDENESRDAVSADGGLVAACD